MLYILVNTYVRLFPDDTQPHFSKHLLKTVCTDLVNLVFNTIAADHMMSLNDESQITADVSTAACLLQNLCNGLVSARIPDVHR